MKKKYFTLFIAMLLIFTLCFTIVACGETDDDKTNDNKPIEKPSVEDQQPSDGDDLPSVPDEPSEPETPGDGEENEEDTTSLVFELKEDDTYKVIGYTGEPISIVIPSSYNGKAVTSIGEKAFYNCTSLISVRIPNSVTDIADKAFYGCVRLVEVYNLSNLTITEDESNSYLGNYALDVYTSLDNPSKLSIDNNGYIIYTDGEERRLVGYSGDETELVIPNGINIINKYAFCEVSTIDDFVIYGTETRVTIPNTAITSIVIPNSVTRIEAHAFHWCDRLTSITIPSSVTSMGEHAFNGCERLVEVYNLSSLNIIEDYSDYGDVGYYALDVYTSLDTPSKLSTDSNGYIIYTNGEEKLLVGYTGNETELILPNGITAINNNAFFHFRTITSVEIPNSVLSIGYGVFSGCISLIEVKIGDSVKSIGNGAFNYCGSLTSVTIGNSVESIGDYAFSGCTSLTIYCEAESQPSGWGLSWDYTYRPVVWGYDASNLKIIDGVQYYIKDGRAMVTGHNANVTNVTILSTIENNGVTYSVTSIGNSAFSGCTSLASIEIPSSVTSIGEGAFGYCTSLTSIVIPSSVTSIGHSAFEGCTSLTIYCEAESQPSGWDSSWNASNRLVVWGYDASNLKIIDGVYYYIKDGSAMVTGRNANVTNVTILSTIESNGVTYSVTSIGDAAFADCTSLASIEIPGSVTSIGNNAFYYCWSLTSVVIEDGVTIIGNGAFSGCKSLASIEIPSSVTSIGYGAFYDCTSLTSIEIPSSVTSIGGWVFWNCTSLTSIEIPSSVTSIDNEAFSGCTSLTSIVIPSSVTSIGNYAFRNCTSLASILIPSSVTSIGYNVFSGCTSLTIYCEAGSKPSGWSTSWNSDRPVVWGYSENA